MLIVFKLGARESKIQSVPAYDPDEVGGDAADGAVIGNRCVLKRSQRRLSSDTDDRELRTICIQIRGEADGAGVETSRLVGRGLMPKLHACKDVHGEFWAEDLAVAGSQAVAIIGPAVPWTGWVGRTPKVRIARLELLLIGVAEVSSRRTIDVVVYPHQVLVGVRRSGGGHEEIVGQSRLGSGWIVADQ